MPSSQPEIAPREERIFRAVNGVTDRVRIPVRGLMQAGTFGSRFALRFAPLTLAVAVTSSALIGWWLL